MKRKIYSLLAKLFLILALLDIQEEVLAQDLALAKIQDNEELILSSLPEHPYNKTEVKNIQAPIQIKGRITDEEGEGLPGVTIIIKGTTIGTTTNVDGQFSFSVPSSDAVLVISYVGFISQEIEVGTQTDFNIQLKGDSQALDEVVVVGYGYQRKIETLGSQSSVKIAELKQPVANLTTVLAGRVSGLVGVQRSAEPGLDNADLWIRGINTLSNSRPLFLVDGVERSFSNLDPNDIESFTILKDAASTSVYGVRGANGVVLITTKKGEAGRTKINFDFYKGITEFTRVPEVADGVTYMQMANEASVTRGGSPIYSPDLINKTYTQEDPYLYPNVNWMDEIFNRFGHNTKANLNITGGSEKMTYYVSAGYYNETGLFKTDDLQQYNSEISYTRYNFTSRLTINATKTTSIDLGIKGWIGNGNYPGTGTNTIFGEAFETYPILYPKMYPDNREPWLSTGGGLNSPYALLTNRGYVSTFNNQVYSDIHVKQDLDFWVKGLSARVLYAFDASSENRLSRIKSPTVYFANSRDEDGELVYETTGVGQDYLSFGRTNGGSRQFYLESALNYHNTFGKHHVGGLFLYNQTDRTSATANNLILSIPYRSLGLVGRATYSYDDRYLAEVSAGYNGAENFAPTKRFGFFPSAAIGWVPSNEKFFGNFKNTIQFLKFRASYGLVGNSKIQIFNPSSPDARDRFLYLPQVGDAGGYSYGKDRGNSIGGLEISRFASDVTWETETDVNLGVELTTLKGALNLEVDFFNRRRKNIFLQRGGVPSFVGVSSNLVGNLGITNNRGIDITGTYGKDFGDLSVQLRGTFTYNENEYIENDQPAQPYPHLERRGHGISQYFGYIADGFYTQEEIDDELVAKPAGQVMAGDLKLKDLSGDGVIDGLDQTVFGQSDVPQIVYGFGTTLAYKGFSLGAFFQGVSKVDLYLAPDFMPFRNSDARGSLYSNIYDRWTPENPRQDAFYPRLSYGENTINYSATNSHWLMNGAFLRLKTLDFGWTIPNGSLSKYGVQNMRIYFIGYNLLTFSSFKMYDPELGNGAGNRYPNIRTYSLGLTVSF